MTTCDSDGNGSYVELHKKEPTASDPGRKLQEPSAAPMIADQLKGDGMFDAGRIRECIGRAALTEMELSPEVARDVAFHMTDWLDDLQRYVKFCEAPESFEPEEIDKLLLAFLAHVPNHLAAAAKLYADQSVTDVFGVGTTSSTAPSD